MLFFFRVFLLQMAEKTLVPSSESGVLDTEAKVRGMFRAIEHLGRTQPASPSSVVLEELSEAVGALALPPPPIASASAKQSLRRPWAASAAVSREGLAAVPAENGIDRSRSGEARDERGGASALADDGPLVRTGAPLEDGPGEQPPCLGRGGRGAAGMGRLPGQDSLHGKKKTVTLTEVRFVIFTRRYSDKRNRRVLLILHECSVKITFTSGHQM